MAKQLSGWMWTWIICAAAIWAFGAGWAFLHDALPSLSPSASEACSYYFGTVPNDHADYVRRCLADPTLQEQARRRYLSSEWQLFGIVAALWFFLPILPGFLILLVAKVWGGLKAH
jgi:hypothetical protein